MATSQAHLTGQSEAHELSIPTPIQAMAATVPAASNGPNRAHGIPTPTAEKFRHPCRNSSVGPLKETRASLPKYSCRSEACLESCNEMTSRIDSTKEHVLGLEGKYEAETAWAREEQVGLGKKRSGQHGG